MAISLIVFLCFFNQMFLEDIPFKITNDFDNYSHNFSKSCYNYSMEQSTFLTRHLTQKSCNLQRQNKLYFIQISMGNPSKEYKLKLSTLFQGISLIDIRRNRKGYNSTTSITFKPIKENHTNFLGWGVISADTLRINETEIEINDVPFLLVKKTHYATTLYSGLFGLAYDTEDASEDNAKSTFDFIGNLPKLKDSYSPLIGLKCINESDGVMSIGELPEEIHYNIKLYHKCPLLSIKNQHSWSCRLNAIYFKDLYLYQINSKIDFTLGGSSMVVPKDLYEIMVERYFKTEFENETCRYNEDEAEYFFTRFVQIVCNKNYDTQRIGLIAFVFGKWTLKISSEKLFYYSKQSHYFSIVFDKDGDNYLVFSSILLSDYYIFFDKQNKHLGFYHWNKEKIN